MAKFQQPTYDSIDRPYDNQGLRTSFDVTMNGVEDVTQTESARTIKAGTALNDIWIDTWIKSGNYAPKTRGFYLDAKRGFIEAQWIAVGSGVDMYGNDAYFYDSSKATNITINAAGLGYIPGDIVTVNGGTVGSLATIVILSVDTVLGSPTHGKVTGFSLSYEGLGYSVANGVSTSGGTGTGFKINIVAVNEVGAIQPYTGDMTTLNFQRKFYPKESFIMQKRVGSESPSEAVSDNVFEMYYPYPNAASRGNYIFIGRSGQTLQRSLQYNDFLVLYGNYSVQAAVGARFDSNQTNFNMINTGDHGSLIALISDQPDTYDYLLVNPVTGEEYTDPTGAVIDPWSGGGGFIFSVFDPADTPLYSRSQLIIQGGLSNDSGAIWNFNISANGTGYAAGNVVTVVGGTTGATIKVVSVTGTGAVIDCKLLTHGTEYSIAAGVATTGGAGTGFKIDITEVGQTGNIWIGRTILPQVCDDLVTPPTLPNTASSLGSSIYIFKSIYAHRHYFDTTHYAEYNAATALFDFGPGGSIHTAGDLMADGNLIISGTVVQVNGSNFTAQSITYLDGGGVPQTRTFLVI